LLIRLPNYEDLPKDEIQFTIALSEEPFFNLDIKSVVGTFSDMVVLKQMIVSTLKMVIRRLLVDPNGRTYTFSPKTGFKLVSIPMMTYVSYSSML
jgi:hypothetical protein